MNNLRCYGHPPYTVAVIHGGPGAGGEMVPVARRLAERRGVLEPIQTATTLEGQVEELARQLQDAAALPVTLIGYSWGAWLSFILAARYPHLVGKLVLVSSAPFEAKYVSNLQKTRLDRLSQAEGAEFETIIRVLGNGANSDKDALLARLGELAGKADSYDLLPDDCQAEDRIGPQGDVFQSVWSAAAAMRLDGSLLALGRDIRCPVTAIHGDYDPHPAVGVAGPLAAVLPNFRFILLRHCGHTPWREREAREEFYCTLEEELAFVG